MGEGIRLTIRMQFLFNAEIDDFIAVVRLMELFTFYAPNILTNTYTDSKLGWVTSHARQRVQETASRSNVVV
jgi:hypothetical protein